MMGTEAPARPLPPPADQYLAAGLRLRHLLMLILAMVVTIFAFALILAAGDALNRTTERLDTSISAATAATPAPAARAP